MARSSSRTAKTYPSKVDVWLFALVAAVIGAMFVGMGISIAQEGWLRFIQGAFVVLGVIGFLVWIVLGTNYTLEGRELIVRSGPFTWRIAIDQISSIEKPQRLRARPFQPRPVFRPPDGLVRQQQAPDDLARREGKIPGGPAGPARNHPPSTSDTCP
jgi:hypothetical protein